MHADWLGNPVTVTKRSALAAIDNFSCGMLAYESRAEHIVVAADGAPEECLVNAYAGMLWMLLESPDAAARAQPYLLNATHGVAGATLREQLNVEFLQAWMSGDVAGALFVGNRLAAEFPRDLLMVKMAQYLQFNRGDFPALLRTALRVAGSNSDIAYMHGMLAFGYEQCHLLEEAEQSARRALVMQRKEPWAQHALAHVYLTRGQITEGVRFLESVRDTWTGLNSFMYTHQWWHLALFYLSQGRYADVLEIYDQHCWRIAKNYSQDQIGAVSLLARMELAGIDVGGRWVELGQYLAVRAHDTVQPFLTLQYVYGLARAHRPEADVLMDAVRARASQSSEASEGAHDAFEASVWKSVALPACEGLLSHARKNYRAAREHLSLALPRIIEVGGSHAQRDLFEQILLDAQINSGALVLAQQTLELRRATDPVGVPVNRALAQVYDALELPEQANQSRARIHSLHAH